MSRGLGFLWLAAVGGFIYLPVMVLVLYSFQGGRLPVPPFTGPSLKWYEAVLADPRLMGALGNSVLVAVLSSAVAVVLGFLAAYGLARFTWRFSGAVRLLLTAPLMVSTLVLGMGLLILLNALGLPKSLVTAGAGHVVLNLPLCLAILHSQLGAQQANIERAARDLGAREWQVLWHVTVPMLVPGIFAAFFLSMTVSWDEFVLAFLLTRFEVTLPVEIWTLLRAGLSPRLNAVGALVFLASALAVIAHELLSARARRRG